MLELVLKAIVPALREGIAERVANTKVAQTVERGYQFVKEQCNDARETIEETIDGYMFARQLVMNVKADGSRIQRGVSTLFTNTRLAVELCTYKLAWASASDPDQGTYHDFGMCLYGIINRKDDRLLNDLWKAATKKN